MTTMADVRARAATSPHSHNWFAPDTMAWFHCQVVRTVVDLGGNESLFLTSDVFGSTEADRVYNLRHQDADGDITTVLDSMPNDPRLAVRTLRAVGWAMRAGDLIGPIPYDRTPRAYAARALHELSR